MSDIPPSENFRWERIKSATKWAIFGVLIVGCASRPPDVSSEAEMGRLQDVLIQFVSYVESGEQCYVESEKEELVGHATTAETVAEKLHVVEQFVDLVARNPDCQDQTVLSIILEGASEFVSVDSAREKLGIPSQ